MDKIRKVKTLKGYTALARFLAEAKEMTDDGLPMTREYPVDLRMVSDKFSYSQTHQLFQHNDREIFWIEISHAKYVVYQVA